ncbi:uncharacterized protein MONOS_16791 [Monocercomonoides exilis]|uniref:uncharacterized protein n=1 Tax=Monocercomonoides exilis TaxID=2049356 RepID=UPI003559EAAB|nr:hypothetical protein MONOS_16791 [Monocercomonoides exilis]|eukprot:MONOS_16791.1-p1 / transcript=MONOS_16791.1 / gene=MONOS_16791 / organism=Monocercomonoides_exilis_PA203 / gene_product=unspecified product / transcript_product=unspecified product / location=Mono_scaffold00037:148973-151452(+) / protein_length=632 / sequence_SO=supercontig / SO=protein_coding / is_pseudo=false
MIKEFIDESYPYVSGSVCPKGNKNVQILRSVLHQLIDKPGSCRDFIRHGIIENVIELLCSDATDEEINSNLETSAHSICALIRLVQLDPSVSSSICSSVLIKKCVTILLSTKKDVNEEKKQMLITQKLKLLELLRNLIAIPTTPLSLFGIQKKKGSFCFATNLPPQTHLNEKDVLSETKITSSHSSPCLTSPESSSSLSFSKVPASSSTLLSVIVDMEASPIDELSDAATLLLKQIKKRIASQLQNTKGTIGLGGDVISMLVCSEQRTESNEPEPVQKESANITSQQLPIPQPDIKDHPISSNTQLSSQVSLVKLKQSPCASHSPSPSPSPQLSAFHPLLQHPLPSFVKAELVSSFSLCHDEEGSDDSSLESEEESEQSAAPVQLDGLNPLMRELASSPVNTSSPELPISSVFPLMPSFSSPNALSASPSPFPSPSPNLPSLLQLVWRREHYGVCVVGNCLGKPHPTPPVQTTKDGVVSEEGGKSKGGVYEMQVAFQNDYDALSTGVGIVEENHLFLQRDMLGEDRYCGSFGCGGTLWYDSQMSDGNSTWHNNAIITLVADTRGSVSTLHLFINGEQQPLFFSHLPKHFRFAIDSEYAGTKVTFLSLIECSETRVKQNRFQKEFCWTSHSR